MGRLVRKPQVADLDQQIAGLEGVLQSGIAGLQAANAEPGDGYLERMVKYVPAEIIAFSMVINAILDQAMKSGGENTAMAGVPVPVIASGALVVACMLTPLFCWSAPVGNRLRANRGAIAGPRFLMSCVAPWRTGKLFWCSIPASAGSRSTAR